MSDNLIDAVDRYINNYSDIMNNFSPLVLRRTSRYYDITHLHTSIIRKIKNFSGKTKNFTPADGQCMKQMLIESLDLADRKEGISERIKDMVEEDMYKFNKSIKDVKVADAQQNKQKKKPIRMLKWVPNYKENDSDSTDNVLNVDGSNEHATINEAKTTKTSKKKFRLPRKVNSKFQTSVATVIDTNENVKKRTKNNKPRTQRSTTKVNTSKSSDDDSEVEPTYCICEEISYGKMVCCDNDLCPIEWFHFKCVSLTKKPKGKWYCPRCRGTSTKVMKSRKILSKELEEYNKRKEEGQ